MMNLQDIIKDRLITKQDNLSFAGLNYECWEVQPPVWSDQVETLLESGYLLFIDDQPKVFVIRPINPSPQAIMQNKEFHKNLREVLHK